jgi:hypothetical protein
MDLSRCRRISFSAQILLEICKSGMQGVEVIANPLPDDAQVLALWDAGGGVLSLVIHSETYEPVSQEGGAPEVPDPVFRRVEALP